jgi:hypothetical protein
VTRGKTARHLAALANHGGGYFIVGIRDDRSLDEAKRGYQEASIAPLRETPHDGDTRACSAFVIALHSRLTLRKELNVSPFYWDLDLYY